MARRPPVNDEGSGAAGPGQCADPSAALDALRARGADRLDPVRFRFIEALARRAAAHDGQARRVLDDKLAEALAACGQGLERAAVAGDGAGSRALAPGPLAELVGQLARHASPQEPALVPAVARAAAPSPPELKALGHFRRTWSRLNAHQRLTQALAKVPENAGPLNSNQLVHRSLTLMRDLSPEYLDHFMAYVDALLWLDRVNGGAPPGKEAPRG